MEKVSIIIPTLKERKPLLDKLLNSIPAGCEVIVVDDEKLFLSQKRNKGARLAHGDYLLFIDDDNYLQPNAVAYARWFFEKDIAILGMMALYASDKRRAADGGSKRHYISGFMRGLNTNTLWWKVGVQPYEVDEVANAFMIKRDLFNALGGFDEVNFPIELDEADLCLRAKKRGYRIMICPSAICYHDSLTYSWMPNFRRSRSAYFMGRNRILFQKKHLTTIQLAWYLLIFLPMFIAFYCACLIYRRKFRMLFHFMKGVLHGLQGRTAHTY